MNWNTLYILMFAALAASVLAIVGKRRLLSAVKLLAVNKIEVLLLAVSLFAFLHYLQLNVSVNWHDELGYIGKGTSQIFRVDPPVPTRVVRTYGYCSLVSAFKTFMTIRNAKLVISILQLLLFWGTCAWMGNVSQKDGREKGVARYLPFFLLVTNLYLVQSTTLLLTDLMASCLVAIAVTAMIYMPLSMAVVVGAVGTLSVAGMIRPAAFCFLAMMPFVYVIRQVSGVFMKSPSASDGRESPESVGGSAERRFSLGKFLRPLPFSVIVFCTVVFPQLMINQELLPYYVRFPIVYQLSESQKVWGTQMLKCIGVVNEELSPYPMVKYRIPEKLRQIPGGLRLGHLAALFDQGEPNTYKMKYDSLSRKGASFFYYMFTYCSLVGVLAMLFRRGRRLELLLLCLSVSLYLFLLSSSAVESRFAYPVILLAFPLAVQGVKFAFARHGPVTRAVLVLGFVALECAAFALSYWMDTLHFVL